MTPVGNGLPRGATNKLTDRRVKAFIAEARADRGSVRRIGDGGSLYLSITPKGTPTWQVRYRLTGKERVFSAGVYPATTLSEARAARDLVRREVLEGRDPVKARLVRRAAASAASELTFAAAAESWLAKKKGEWTDVHFEKSSQALERDVLPYLGQLPLAEITSAMIAKMIERITSRGVHETAAKILWHVRCVFEYAQARGQCDSNPAEPVRSILRRPQAPTRRAALLTSDGLRDILRRTEREHLSPSVRLAHRLCAYTAARIGNVVAAHWSQVDLEAQPPTWTVPRAQMKVRGRHHDHRMILGPTIAAELRLWRETIGGTGFLFPSPALNGPRVHITRESIEKVYRVTLKLSGIHSVHGWRASLSTLARDAGFSKDVVALALDHVHDSEVARAYDRGERLVERLRLALWWDGELSGQEPDPKVLPIRARA